MQDLAELEDQFIQCLTYDTRVGRARAKEYLPPRRSFVQ